MGKNQRHKKNLKADKAKVKLKQSKTKFLPKGQNVTKTNFKIKPIIIQEQLKEKIPDVPLSKRKLDVKDLLSRLKHYNENVRHKACVEMAEMVKLYSEEIVNHHLSVIILSASTLMQDKETKVRRAAIKVVNALLEVVPDGKLEPFYNYFLVNLRCAMTNINKNIQEDSLMFLDSFLMYNCKMISKNPEKLLPDFFTLISKLRSESNLERTLTVNLGSKMTSVTWRIKVLSRLHAVLEKILAKNLENVSKDENMNQVFDADLGNTFPLYKSKFCEQLANPNWAFLRTSYVDSSTVNLEKNIATVVPLLYEIWIEVMPEKKFMKSSNENTTITEEAAAILHSIMNTMYLLWKYVTKLDDESLVKKVFLSDEGKKFLDHLVSNFPYKQSNNRKKKAIPSNELKVLELNLDTQCNKENILICLIYSALNINVSKRTKNIGMGTIIDYVLGLLSGQTIVDQNNAQFLLDFLKLSLLDSYYVWRKCGIDLKLILHGTIQFYNNISLRENLKLDLFKLLADLVNSPLVQKGPHYSAWLESLPDLLTAPKISEVEVNCLLNMSKRGSITFHEALNKKLPKILENLDNISIVINNPSMLNTVDNVSKNMVNIFFYLPKIGKIKSRIIYEYILTHKQSKYADYLEYMLELRKEFRK